MHFCKSIKFCFYLGFAAMIAHAVLASLILLLAFVIELLTMPMFMDQLMMHEMFGTLCIFLAISWLLSPFAVCFFKKAMAITECHECMSCHCSTNSVTPAKKSGK